MIQLKAVNTDNWREVCKLSVKHEQQAYVATPSYYLALCCYDPTGWKPLAIVEEDTMIGFMMWAVDVADGSCWLGGFLIDQQHQGKGYGKAALKEVIRLLQTQHGYTEFALSYAPDNHMAKGLYLSIGFTETKEMEGDEVIARYRV